MQRTSHDLFLRSETPVHGGCAIAPTPTGGTGADTYLLTAGASDTIIEEVTGGPDMVNGSSASDSILLPANVENADGGDGDDRIEGNTGEPLPWDGS